MERYRLPSCYIPSHFSLTQWDKLGQFSRVVVDREKGACGVHLEAAFTLFSVPFCRPPVFGSLRGLGIGFLLLPTSEMKQPTQPVTFQILIALLHCSLIKASGVIDSSEPIAVSNSRPK